jgi:type I restriction enzyme R subunit
MPPVTRFGGGGRAQKKQGVIGKLKAFFERFFGLGNANFTAEEQKHEAIVYDMSSIISMAAEPADGYGKKQNDPVEG